MIRSILFILLAAVIRPCVGQEEKVLMTINDKPVYVSEFTYIYEKNNRDNADYSKESLQEYLDLYINFKLKVHKARQEGYDLKQDYIDELAGYRNQLSNGYVYEREVIDNQVTELLERKKYDLKISHIMVSLDRDASQEEVDDARKKIASIKALLDGGRDFPTLARDFSQDPSSAHFEGNVGYLTAPLPEGYTDFEDAAYGLEVGEISEVVRSDLGYHILKLTDRRPARGVIQARHILIRNEKRGIPLAGAALRIMEIYKKLLAGSMLFEDLARTESEDLRTAPAGGDLGYFGIGQYERAFEDAAFALQNDGDISEPVETSLGWHIIQRVGKRPPSTEASIRNLIKGQMANSERVRNRVNVLVSDIKNRAAYSEDPGSLQIFRDSIDESFEKYDWRVPNFKDRKLISLGGETYNLYDFGNFCKSSTRTRLQNALEEPEKDVIMTLYNDFVEQTAIEYAQKNLEQQYPAFKNLMREYEEGILLFEITREKVWDRASIDTSGLRAYYKKHSANYKWEERIEITKYTLQSEDVGNVAGFYMDLQKMDNEAILAKYNKDGQMSIETIIAEKGSAELKDLKASVGYTEKPVFNKTDGEAVIRKVTAIIPPGQKSLREARGYVVSDYQEELEKEWIKGLKNEFKVVVNNPVLQSLQRKAK